MEFEGRYFDGSSLEPVHVSVHVAYRSVSLKDGGRRIGEYPSDQIVLLYADRYGNRVDLGLKGHRDVRIIIEAEGVRSTLSEALPQLSASFRKNEFALGVRIAAFLFAGLVVLGLALWQLEKVAYKLVPESMERDLGQGIAQSVIKEFGAVCSTPDGDSALVQLLGTLKAVLPVYQQTYFRVRVIDSDVVNAFALPGGELMIMRGLLEEAVSAEEVAGVLAHEMGHAYHQHSLRGLVRTLGLTVIGTMLSGADVSSLSQELVLLAYSRSMEREADGEAIRLLNAANISTLPLAGFFERQSGSAAPKAVQFFSTHPTSSERMERLRRADRGKAVAMTQGRWQALKTICGSSERRDSR